MDFTDFVEKPGLGTEAIGGEAAAVSGLFTDSLQRRFVGTPFKDKLDRGLEHRLVGDSCALRLGAGLDRISRQINEPKMQEDLQ